LNENKLECLFVSFVYGYHCAAQAFPFPLYPHILFHATFWIFRTFYFMSRFGLFTHFISCHILGCMIRWEGLPGHLVKITLVHFVSSDA